MSIDERGRRAWVSIRRYVLPSRRWAKGGASAARTATETAAAKVYVRARKIIKRCIATLL